MADVKLIDIDGVQWELKDEVARNKIADLETKTSVNFNYSLNETEIGKWINGEKIYRLVVIGNTTGGETIIPLGDKNIKSVISINGVFTSKSGVVHPFDYFLPVNISEYTRYYGIAAYRGQNKELFIGLGPEPNFNDIPFIIQIEYIKNE